MSLNAEQLKGWIARQTGLDAELLDREWFESLMNERLRIHGLAPSLTSYRNLLASDPDELQKVVNEVTVPETWFFRYPASFDLLTEYLRKFRKQLSPIPQLRMLSIACATGEEPVSMAIAAARADWPLEKVRVDAIDREPRHLARAQENRFSSYSVREALPAWTERWLQREGDDLVVAAEIMACIEWKLVDVTVLETPFAASYHVIFCRNLLVYLNRRARLALTNKLSELLTNGGYLFAGHADALELLRERFERQDKHGAFAYRAFSSNCQVRDDPPLRLPQPPCVEPRPNPGVRLVEPPPKIQTPASLEDAIKLADGGELPNALKICESLMPSVDPQLFALMGSILLAMNQCSEARVALRKSIYLNSANADALLQLAIVEERLGELIQAENYRRRAASLHDQEAKE